MQCVSYLGTDKTPTPGPAFPGRAQGRGIELRDKERFPRGWGGPNGEAETMEEEMGDNDRPSVRVHHPCSRKNPTLPRAICLAKLLHPVAGEREAKMSTKKYHKPSRHSFPTPFIPDRGQFHPSPTAPWGLEKGGGGARAVRASNVAKDCSTVASKSARWIPRVSR